MNTKQVFTDIYRQNLWDNEESVSGHGSTLRATSNIRRQLPALFVGLGVTSILNIPCGDVHWWMEMRLPSEIEVIHADIVTEIISDIGKNYSNQNVRVLDIISDPLPKVDLIFTRDCLGHLSNDEVERALDNIKRSGSTYLLTTHFPDSKWRKDADIQTGAWRPIDLDKQFGLGLPILSLSEHELSANRQYDDKCLALWRIT